MKPLVPRKRVGTGKLHPFCLRCEKHKPPNEFEDCDALGKYFHCNSCAEEEAHEIFFAVKRDSDLPSQIKRRIAEMCVALVKHVSIKAYEQIRKDATDELRVTTGKESAARANGNVSSASIARDELREMFNGVQPGLGERPARAPKKVLKLRKTKRRNARRKRKENQNNSVKSQSALLGSIDRTGGSYGEGTTRRNAGESTRSPSSRRRILGLSPRSRPPKILEKVNIAELDL